ncbi:hypothetical protein [Mycoplasmopsis opalescens]|uniref:hypothetical protein n=1 Tax=Mycoplasmopsis opalescens TaxID=114886 RepID=UPI0004A6E6FD|nr:hypothetical protein [Mycoplasmopsis opalescens]
MNSGITKNILFILIIVIFIIFIVSITSLLIWRLFRTKIKKIKTNQKAYLEEINNFSYYLHTSILRLKNYYKNNYKYITLFEEAEKNASKIEKHNQSLKILLENLYIELEHKKISLVFKIYKQVQIQWKIFLVDKDKFNKLVGSFNKNWEEVDNLSGFLQSLLLDIKAYIIKNQNLIPNSFETLIDEANKLLASTCDFDERRKHNDITEINRLINEHHKRVVIFAKKIDSAINIEKSLFTIIPVKIAFWEQKEEFKNEYIKLKEFYENIKNNQPFANITKTEKQLRIFYNDERKLREILNYQQNSQILAYDLLADFRKTFNHVYNKINLYISIYDQDENEISDIKQTQTKLVNLKKSLDYMESSAEKKENISFDQIKFLINEIRILIDQFNHSTDLIVNKHNKINYTKYLLKTYKFLVFYANKNENLLKNNAEIYDSLTQLNIEIYALVDEFNSKEYLDIKDSKLIKFQNKLNSVLTVIQKQKIYSSMVDQFISKIDIISKKQENIKIQKLHVINLKQQYKFKEAFDVCVKYIKKGVWDV